MQGRESVATSDPCFFLTFPFLSSFLFHPELGVWLGTRGSVVEPLYLLFLLSSAFWGVLAFSLHTFSRSLLKISHSPVIQQYFWGWRECSLNDKVPFALEHLWENFLFATFSIYAFTHPATMTLQVLQYNKADKTRVRILLVLSLYFSKIVAASWWFYLVVDTNTLFPGFSSYV